MVLLHQIDQRGDGTGKTADGVQRGGHTAAAVAAQIHDPVIRLAGIGPQRIHHMAGGFLPKGLAGQKPDVAVQQLAVGGGYHKSPAGEGYGIGLLLPQIGQLEGGALLTGQQGAGLVQVHPCQRGAVHSGDDITGLETARLRRGVGDYPAHQQPAIGQGEGEAGPYLLGIGEGGIESGIFLGGKILGIGVAQRLDDAGYGPLLQYLRRDRVYIKRFQQHKGLTGGQSLSGGSEQKRQSQRGGRQSEAQFHGYPPERIMLPYCNAKRGRAQGPSPFCSNLSSIRKLSKKGGSLSDQDPKGQKDGGGQ